MLATPWWVIWTNGRSSFPTDSSAGKPQNEVELSLISGQVVKPQSRCGRRRRSKACVSTVTTMVSQRSPLTCCWGLCLQWESVAIVVLAVAGDGGDVFIGGEIQSFFFWYRFTIGCCAPVAPHIVVPARIKIAHWVGLPCADLGDVLATHLDADTGYFPFFCQFPIAPCASIARAGGRRYHCKSEFCCRVWMFKPLLLLILSKISHPFNQSLPKSAYIVTILELVSK